MVGIEKKECVKCPIAKYSATGNKFLCECQDCKFHGGLYKEGDEQKVLCYVNEIPDFAKAHVTSFEKMENWKVYRYEARTYNSAIDGPIEGDDPEDYCQKCCFDKTLPNGERICVLRNGVDRSMVTAFCCYEGEIWKKTLKTDLTWNDEEDNEITDKEQVNENQ